MAPPSNNGKIKKIVGSKFFTAFVAVLIFFMAISVANISSKKSESGKEIKGLETKVSNIEQNNNYLEKFLSYFKSPSFLEKEARMNLNYKASGEDVVFVYLDKSGNQVKTTDFGEKLASMKNYQKWFYYLLGY